MALQFSITAIGSIVLQTSVNSLGSLAVTSVTAAQKICAIVMGPLESLGITMATFCGQNLGAKSFTGSRRHSPEHVRFHVLLCILHCFPVDSGKIHRIPVPRSSETEVIRLAVQYMRLNAIFYPVLGVLFILRNSCRAWATA